LPNLRRMMTMNGMLRARVQSTNLKSVGYDAESKTLELEFHTGEVYQYYNVPAIVHRDLIHASSIGQYFSYFIKTTYRSRKVAG
jgi:hypothetical protein